MTISGQRAVGLLGRGLVFVALIAIAVRLASYVSTGGDVRAAAVAVLAFCPIGLYLAIRAPLLFPFGAYLLLVPFDPLLSFSGGVGPTLTRYVGMVSGAALLAGMLLRRHVYAPPRSYYAWFAASGFMLLTALWSSNLDQTMFSVNRMLQVFGLVTLLALYPVSLSDLKNVVRMIVASAAVAALYALWFARRSSDAFEAGRLIVYSGHLHLDPNIFGANFVLPSALVVSGFLTERRLTTRFACAVLFALYMATLLLCASRGAFIGVGIVIIYLGIRLRRYLALALVGLVGAALSFAIPSIWARFADLQASHGSGRSDIWAVAVHALRDGAWLSGVGFGCFAEAYNRNLLQSAAAFEGWDRVAHNVLLQSWVETGIFGLLLMLFAWWCSLRQNVDIKPGEPLYPAAVAVEASVVALFVDALTIDMLWQKYLWLAFSLAMLIANVRHPHALLTKRLRTFPQGMPLRVGRPVHPKAAP